MKKKRRRKNENEEDIIGVHKLNIHTKEATVVSFGCNNTASTKVTTKVDVHAATAKHEDL